MFDHDNLIQEIMRELTIHFGEEVLMQHRPDSLHGFRESLRKILNESTNPMLTEVAKVEYIDVYYSDDNPTLMKGMTVKATRYRNLPNGNTLQQIILAGERPIVTNDTVKSMRKRVSELEQQLIELGFCPECMSTSVMGTDGPFSDCECGSSEDYASRPLQKLQLLERAGVYIDDQGNVNGSLVEQATSWSSVWNKLLEVMPDFTRLADTGDACAVEAIGLLSDKKSTGSDSLNLFTDKVIKPGIGEAKRAMRDYPQPNYVLLKLGEEIGEVIGAGVKWSEGRGTAQDYQKEMTQVIAMLYRLFVEGDKKNGILGLQTTLTSNDDDKTWLLKDGYADRLAAEDAVVARGCDESLTSLKHEIQRILDAHFWGNHVKVTGITAYIGIRKTDTTIDLEIGRSPVRATLPMPVPITTPYSAACVIMTYMNENPKLWQ